MAEDRQRPPRHAPRAAVADGRAPGPGPLPGGLDRSRPANPEVDHGTLRRGAHGMLNAIVPDDPLFTCGVFKERLAQSARFYASQQVRPSEAAAALRWLQTKGMRFHFGKDPE